MGWTSTYRKAAQPLADFFIEQGTLRWTNPEQTHRVLDAGTVNCSEFYAAVEVVDHATKAREVWCVVILVRMYRETAEGYNISYKEMTEHSGPGVNNCPERILDLLTPVTDQYAVQWRALCREQIALRKTKPPLVPGTVLLADPPIPFRDGTQQGRLTITGRRGSRISLEGGYRLSTQWINQALANHRISFVPAT